MGLFGKNTGPTDFDHGNQNQFGDPFEKVGKADGSERSIYPLAGVYPLLYCERLKMIESKLNGDSMFIAEFSILESNVADRPKGTTMAWVCNLRHLPSPGNVRAFLATLNGVPVNEVDSDSARFACGEKNPCRGRLVRLEAVNTETKKHTQFTVCKWSAVNEEMQKKADELRQAAGFPAF